MSDKPIGVEVSFELRRGPISMRFGELREGLEMFGTVRSIDEMRSFDLAAEQRLSVKMHVIVDRSQDNLMTLMKHVAVWCEQKGFLMLNNIAAEINATSLAYSELDE